MIDENFIKYINEGSKYIVGIADQLPKQFERMKKDISPEAAQRIQEAMTFSGLKEKMMEFQEIKKDLDNTIKKYE